MYRHVSIGSGFLKYNYDHLSVQQEGQQHDENSRPTADNIELFNQVLSSNSYLLKKHNTYQRPNQKQSSLIRKLFAHK